MQLKHPNTPPPKHEKQTHLQNTPIPPTHIPTPLININSGYLAFPSNSYSTDASDLIDNIWQ